MDFLIFFKFISKCWVVKINNLQKPIYIYIFVCLCVCEKIIINSSTSFSKKRCGNPESRVAVVHSEDKFPDIVSLHTVASQQTYTQVDSQATTTTTTTMLDLLPVCIPLRICIVDQEGGVSFTSIGTSPIEAVVKKKRKKKDNKSSK
jgi:hypothetical protein